MDKNDTCAQVSCKTPIVNKKQNLDEGSELKPKKPNQLKAVDSLHTTGTTKNQEIKKSIPQPKPYPPKRVSGVTSVVRPEIKKSTQKVIVGKNRNMGGADGSHSESMENFKWKGEASHKDFIGKFIRLFLMSMGLFIFLFILIWLRGIPDSVVELFVYLLISTGAGYIVYIKGYLPYLQCKLKRVHSFGWSGKSSVILMDVMGILIMLFYEACQMAEMASLADAFCILLISIYEIVLFFVYILRPYYSYSCSSENELKNELKKILIRCGSVFLAGIVSGYILGANSDLSELFRIVLSVALLVVVIVYFVCRSAVRFACFLDIRNQAYREPEKLQGSKSILSSQYTFDKLKSEKISHGAGLSSIEMKSGNINKPKSGSSVKSVTSSTLK